MQFTNEVNWNLFDFIIAAFLLLSTGFTINFILIKAKFKKYRTELIIAIFIILTLIWAELAVGIFGSPFAGD